MAFLFAEDAAIEAVLGDEVAIQIEIQLEDACGCNPIVADPLWAEVDDR